jgi:hypothetical protein
MNQIGKILGGIGLGVIINGSAEFTCYRAFCEITV